MEKPILIMNGLTFAMFILTGLVLAGIIAGYVMRYIYKKQTGRNCDGSVILGIVEEFKKDDKFRGKYRFWVAVSLAIVLCLFFVV